MQWESGRTRQNLLHSVRESKAKRETIIRRSFERLVPEMFSHQTGPILLCQCFPTLDNLRNFFLIPTAEMLSFFNQFAEAR